MITFDVRTADEFRTAETLFGGEPDVRKISRLPKESPTAVRDALEFARLASKRWRYYRRSIESVSSIREFREVIAAKPSAEVSFHFVGARGLVLNDGSDGLSAMSTQLL